MTKTGRFSVETLVHFKCGNCRRWWTIEGADPNKEYTCPRCNTRQKFEPAPNAVVAEPADALVSEASSRSGSGGSNPLDRTAEAKKIIQEWVDKQGHERCWYYPDLFRRLATLFEVVPTVEPQLPPRPEFELGCRRYQDEEYRQPQQPTYNAEAHAPLNDECEKCGRRYCDCENKY